MRRDHAGGGKADGGTVDRRDDLRIVRGALLAVPVVVLAMVPAWQFRDWQWLSLTLAAPVAVQGAWPHQWDLGAVTEPLAVLT
jgi:P-type Cu+ transporter